MSETFTFLAVLFLNGIDGEPNDVDADQAAFVEQRGGVRYYDFDDDSVEGEVLSSNGSNVDTRKSPHHQSLISIRPSFTPELTRMALDLE